MKDLRVVLMSAVLIAVTGGGAHAATIIENSFVATPAALNLNDFSAWAYYGDTTAVLYGHSSPTPTTDANNLGAFTNFVVSGGSSPYAARSDGNTPTISYTNGAGGPNSSSLSNGVVHDFVQQSNSTGAFSLTTTLFAPTEQLSFYLFTYDTTSDITVTLGGQTFTLTNTVLPELTSGGSINDGSGNRQGVLTLTVTGNVGDLLTFTDKANATGVSTNASGNTGIIAVTAVAVPEPEACVLLLGGLGLLFFVLRGATRHRACA